MGWLRGCGVWGSGGCETVGFGVVLVCGWVWYSLLRCNFRGLRFSVGVFYGLGLVWSFLWLDLWLILIWYCCKSLLWFGLWMVFPVISRVFGYDVCGLCFVLM